MAFTVEESLEFETSPEAAFDALADHASWARWMPASFRPVGPSLGTLRAGVRPWVRVAHLPLPSRLRLEIVERPREIAWGGGVPGVLWGAHAFRFEKGPRGALVRSVETWSGALAALLAPLLRPIAARGAREQLEAIRRGALERARGGTAG